MAKEQEMQTEEAPRRGRPPKVETLQTYEFARPGITEGASGKRWSHQEKKTDGNRVWYEVEAPEGEFDHLWDPKTQEVRQVHDSKDKKRSSVKKKKK